MALAEVFKGFSKLSREERLQRLVEVGALTGEDVAFLDRGGLENFDLAEKFIENVIGYFQLPLGVVMNLRTDGVDRVIPMAVEETSIVAAASKTAKWISEHGTITTTVEGQEIIGQIQIAKVQSVDRLKAALAAHGTEWVSSANQNVVASLVARGGGVRRISLRLLERPDGAHMGVIHVMMDPCDAMGANLINQVCEYLKHPIQKVTGEKVTMCILSNLVDTKVTVAHVRMTGLDAQVVDDIAEASLFAELDPYRAATNNKGVLNGMDPILIATGNDWRAVEAGVHAFAARDGQYRSITKWRNHDGDLVGELRAPIVVGTVGGVTTLHPTAKLCMNLLQVRSASELSRVVAAVGLVQNLGALRALTSVGIIEGHMKLHIKNLAMGAGASESEMPALQRKLEMILSTTKRVSLSNAKAALAELRSQLP